MTLVSTASMHWPSNNCSCKLNISSYDSSRIQRSLEQCHGQDRTCSAQYGCLDNERVTLSSISSSCSLIQTLLKEHHSTVQVRQIASQQEHSQGCLQLCVSWLRVRDLVRDFGEGDGFELSIEVVPASRGLDWVSWGGLLL